MMRNAARARTAQLRIKLVRVYTLTAFPLGRQ